jgi:hypothetical protein
LALMRATALFGPRAWALLLPLSFVAMALLPFLLLDRDGRRRIGLRPALHPRWYPLALLAGAGLASACAGLGALLFGSGADHWFVSVADHYRRQFDSSGLDRWALYLAFTLPALLFSPVGEEIFFRGLLQTALEGRCSERLSAALASALFALLHLCHHGLLLTATGWTWRPVSAALWVLLMFATALALAALRRASGSLYPAMTAHAAFNATMNLWIFTLLWN